MKQIQRAIKDPRVAIQFGMGGVFLGAGLFRILRFDLATKEMAAFGMPPELAWVLIVIEVVSGLCIIVNFYAKQALIIMCGLMCSAFYMAIKTRPELIGEVSELFVFDSTPTDIWLHMIYLFVMLGLVLRLQEEEQGSEQEPLPSAAPEKESEPK